jgi:hypothetical protein
MAARGTPVPSLVRVKMPGDTFVINTSEAADPTVSVYRPDWIFGGTAKLICPGETYQRGQS